MSDSAPLGKNTNIASAFSNTRARRFALQAVARELIPDTRVSICYRWVRGRPEVWHSPIAQRAHYKNLMVCARVWLCPVCASKITERRKEELNQAIKTWRGSVFLVTFTLQHTRDDRLEELVNGLEAAYRGLKSGRKWQSFKKLYQVVGSITAQEMTVSTSAGWHPHKHVLFFSSLPVSKIDYKAIEAELSEHFITLMAKQGRYVSAVYGVRVERPVDAQSEGDQALKAYVTKWGLSAELAKGPVKSGRVESGVLHLSPFQLLDLAGKGNTWAAERFKEYAKAMKRKNQLVWSPGLRKLLKLQEVEKSDEELAEEIISVGDVMLAQLTLYQWRVILANDARAELLSIADSGDAVRVLAFLDLIGAVSEAWQLAPP